MARTHKAAKPISDAPDMPVVATPAPPHSPAEGTSATEGVAAPDVALVQPSVDGGDLIMRDPDAKGPDHVTVVVTGPAKGRWRIGRLFGPEAVTIPLSELTEAQMKAIDGDPELRCDAIPWPQPTEPT